MERIDTLINEYINEYPDIDDFIEKRNMSIMIASLSRFSKEKYPYLHTFLFANHQFEETCTLEQFRLDQHTYSFIRNNYRQLLDFFKSYYHSPIKDINFDDAFINQNFYPIINDFLKTVNPELLYLLKSIIDNNTLLRLHKYNNGEELYDKRKNKFYIIIHEDNTLANMVALVHELGHAYQDYCFQEYHEAYNLHKLLKKEISSHVLEYMFLDYLISQGIYPYIAIKLLINNNNVMMNDIKSLTKEICEPNDPGNNFINPFAYALGKVMAMYAVKNHLSYHDIVSYSHENDPMTIINDLKEEKILKKNKSLQK